MYKPTDLNQHLASLGAAPNKRLSQNFLIDGNIIRKIIETADVQPGDVVLEIGPGPGALTAAILQAGAAVVAVEKDPLLAQGLDKLQTPDNRLEVFQEDILAFPLSRLKPRLPAGRKAKVISNLPYHLTTPILKKLIQEEGRELFSELILMVQDEVAKRFVAKPRTPDYGSLTLFLHFYTTPKYAFKVSNSCFFPKPKVHSAIVKITLKEPEAVTDTEIFFKMTRRAFEQRRKMLRVSLSQIVSPKILSEALIKLALPATSRPEELSLAQFIALYESIREQLTP